MNELTTITFISKLISIPILISSLEFLYNPVPLKDEGLMSWEIGRARNKFFMKGIVGKLLHFFVSYPSILYLLYFRVIMALTIILLPINSTFNFFTLFPLFISEALFAVRTHYGKDGSDQLTWITVIILTLTSISPSSSLIKIALWFLSFHIIYAYFSAGIAKAVAKNWWNGKYVTSIFNMKIYGNPFIGKIMLENKKVALLTGSSIIIWECLFPLILIAPKSFVIPILITGVFFHLCNAVIMGLNCFFFAFIAVYPAIYYVLTSL